MRARTILAIAVLLGSAVLATARLSRAWTYQEMFDDADFVVIARFITTKDTDERGAILELPVVGVLSEFETRLVLKGATDVPTFRLHHYRFASTDSMLVANGPGLISFPEKYRPFYLLFLRRERDDAYAPVTDQIDPDTCVLELPAGGL